MERLWKAAFAVGGVAAIGAFVFWSLYKQWLALPIFERLSQQQTFVVMLVFLALTFFALIAAFVLHARGKGEMDDVLPLYERLRTGLSSPEENVSQIERIANSSDPKKERYLREAASLPDMSFLEVAAISQALSDIASKKTVQDLKVRVRALELKNIQSMIPESDDPLLRPILIQSKYWRYVNRKNHPSYKKMSEFIAIALLKGFNEDALKLSKELEGEFRQQL